MDKCPECGSPNVGKISDKEYFCYECNWDNLVPVGAVQSDKPVDVSTDTPGITRTLIFLEPYEPYDFYISDSGRRSAVINALTVTPNASEE